MLRDGFRNDLRWPKKNNLSLIILAHHVNVGMLDDRGRARQLTLVTSRDFLHSLYNKHSLREYRRHVCNKTSSTPSIASAKSLIISRLKGQEVYKLPKKYGFLSNPRKSARARYDIQGLRLWKCLLSVLRSVRSLMVTLSLHFVHAWLMKKKHLYAVNAGTDSFNTSCTTRITTATAR